MYFFPVYRQNKMAFGSKSFDSVASCVSTKSKFKRLTINSTIFVFGKMAFNLKSIFLGLDNSVMCSSRKSLFSLREEEISNKK